MSNPDRPTAEQIAKFNHEHYQGNRPPFDARVLETKELLRKFLEEASNNIQNPNSTDSG